MNRLHHALQRARAVNQLFVDAEARQAMFLAMMSHELRSPLTAMLGCELEHMHFFFFVVEPTPPPPQRELTIVCVFFMRDTCLTRRKLH